MKIVYSELQAGHDPNFFIVRGIVRRSNEQPERAEVMLRSVIKDGHEVIAPGKYGREHLLAVHTPRYLDFLETAHARWQKLSDANHSEVIANIHPFQGEPCTYPEHIVGQAGWHMADNACPIGPDTWKAAVESATCALHAAELVIQGERVAYSLSRPPGHHAYADRANGFCYLNNVAIAAQYLRNHFERVVIIDIDLHHGNGTQSIFYSRSDVMTVSLHADPSYMTPYYVGYTHEAGLGEGVGYNLNYPLAKGLDTEGYLEALEDACKHINKFKPDAVVVALGLDAYENDPYQGICINTDGFGKILKRIAELNLPTVLVQEGGYLSDALGDNLASALRGFESGII
jgi:acetoin utilization deacetylase AcuC-like enzyme